MAAAHVMYELAPSYSESKSANKMFFGLSDSTISSLLQNAVTMGYDKGEILFGEQDAVSGVYVVLTGKVKLSLNSAEGKSLIVRIACPGDTLGVSSLMLSKPQQVTAEALEDSEVHFIKRADFLNLANRNGEFRLHLAQEISLEYSNLCQAVSRVGLPKAAMVRLAQLFSGWVSSSESSNQVQLPCTLTHEELGQMIDASRETVTRLLHSFREKGLLTLNRQKLQINNLADLRNLAASE